MPLSNSMEHCPSDANSLSKVKKFPASCGTQMFISAFTRADSWPNHVSWSKCLKLHSIVHPFVWYLLPCLILWFFCYYIVIYSSVHGEILKLNLKLSFYRRLSTLWDLQGQITIFQTRSKLKVWLKYIHHHDHINCCFTGIGDLKPHTAWLPTRLTLELMV
jgi:hypothetical protein